MRRCGGSLITSKGMNASNAIAVPLVTKSKQTSAVAPHLNYDFQHMVRLHHRISTAGSSIPPGWAGPGGRHDDIDVDKFAFYRREHRISDCQRVQQHR